MTNPLQLKHVVAATDESGAGRQAIWAARALAARAGARVTVLRVVPLDDRGAPLTLDQLQRWVNSDLPPAEPEPRMDYAIAYGLPGIEIPRFAEQVHADLLVLGRTPRSRTTRLLLGDTADAVARRSRVPCLFVPPRGLSVSRALVAVKGSGREASVLGTADALARQAGVELQLVTVERVYGDEPGHLAVMTPVASSARIGSQVRQTLGREIEVRRGDPAEQILAAIDEHRPDIVVLGCHLGGPAGVIEAGSTARKVIHAARCAVLTVPL